MSRFLSDRHGCRWQSGIYQFVYGLRRDCILRAKVGDHDGHLLCLYLSWWKSSGSGRS